MTLRYLNRNCKGKLAENPIGMTVYWTIKGEQLSGKVVNVEYNWTLGSMQVILENGQRLSSGAVKVAC